MKKIYIMALLVVLVTVPAMALVSNTKHDMVFSGFASAPVGGSTEICVFCHTPHGAQAIFTQAPLWNNSDTAAVSVGTIYNSATMNFTTTPALVNATDARLCLSCHDGTVGMPVNQPNSGDMEVTALVMGANTVIGTDLSNDHPIGISLGSNPEGVDLRYDGAALNLHTISYITGPTGFNENPFFGGAANTIWCSSCHDVHDNTDVPFLRMNNAGSAMCKACHIK